MTSSLVALAFAPARFGLLVTVVTIFVNTFVHARVQKLEQMHMLVPRLPLIDASVTIEIWAKKD